ncbi:hypothetical protein Tco_1403541 [Tanacetum coccineum]
MDLLYGKKFFAENKRPRKKGIIVFVMYGEVPKPWIGFVFCFVALIADFRNEEFEEYLDSTYNSIEKNKDFEELQKLYEKRIEEKAERKKGINNII